MRKVWNSLGASLAAWPVTLSVLILACPVLTHAQSDVTQPGDPIVLVNGVNDGDPDSGPPPGAETVDHAIDNVGQKYLNFLDLGSGLAVQPRVGQTIVTGLRVYTANDEEPRDPASFVLEGSAAGISGPWTQIAQGPLALPSGRNPGGNSPLGGNFQTLSFANATAYLAYRLTFPTLKNAAAANSMQISEIELLGKVVGQCFPGSAGLVSWWRAEGNGFDWAGTNSGTLTGGLGFVSGQVGQAFNFTGNAQSVTVPASATLDVGAGPGLTIEGWINPTQTNSQMPIVEYSDTSGSGLHLWASVTYPPEQPHGAPGSIYAAMGNGLLEGIVATRGVLTPNVWQHVALTYDATSRFARLYLNGVEKTNRFIQAIVGNPLTSTALNIGRRPGFGSFSGKLDEISLYNRALSAAELLAIYNAGGAGKCFAPARLTAISYPRPWLLASAPGSATFLAEATVNLNGVFQSSTQVTFNVTYEMRDQDNGLVPLASNAVSTVMMVPAGTGATLAVPLPLAPLSPLNSVDRMYFITATLSHRFGNAGPLTADNTIGGPTNRFLYFTGRLFFGPRLMNITGFGLPPLPSTPVPGSHIPVTLLNTTLRSPYVPELTFTRTNLVHLLINGDATYNSLPFTVSVPGVAPGVVSNVCFTRSSFTFGASGITANDFSVKLPTGFGYNLGDPAQPRGRILQSSFFVGSEVLDEFLRPTNPTFTSTPPPGSRYFFCEETKPLWIPADVITWHVQEGRFEIIPVSLGNGGLWFYHVRVPEYVALSNAEVVDPDSRYKKSNDRYYEMIGLGSSITVRAGINKEALLSGSLSLFLEDMRTHFPYNNVLTSFASPSGTMTISNDLVVDGGLAIHEASLAFARDCADSKCPFTNGAGSFFFNPSSSMAFTPDGGVVVEQMGFVFASALEWGSVAQDAYVHSITPVFSRADYHMPGTFLRGDITSESVDNRPGFILFSGFGKPGDPNYVERPNTPDYDINGHANYAGMNFRVGAGSFSALTRLAGQTASYPLSSRSKYYVRHGGVSGIHEPVPGTFPTDLMFYGFQFTLSSFGVAYLDNQSQEDLSIIKGSVFLPYPSDFAQTFSRMQISCRGQLESAELPPGRTNHLMRYWGNSITPLAMEFRGTDAERCDPAPDRVLILAVETFAPLVPQALQGLFGFGPDGNLVPPARNITGGVDSRLTLPGNITLLGPGSESYNLTPVGKAYLNNYLGAPDAVPRPVVGSGWMNIAGKLDLPFFEDARVHLHARSNNTGIRIHMMGGWPRPEDSQNQLGWTEGNLHYFNSADKPIPFDANNWGYPGNTHNPALLDKYRDNRDDDFYHPRALQTAFNFIELDYPLDWSSTTRDFKSFRAKTHDLLVLEAGSQVKRITPKSAEITFGAEYSGLPKISIGRLLVDGLDEATGVFKSLSESIGDAASAQLQDGLSSLDRVLSDRFDSFLTQTLSGPVMEPVVTRLCDSLYGVSIGGASYHEPSQAALVGSPSSSLAAGPDEAQIAQNPPQQDCLQNVTGCVYTILNEELQQRLDEAVRSIGAGSILAEIGNVIAQADGVLSVITNITARNDEGVRTIVANIVKELVDNEAVQFAALVADYEILFGTMQKIDPTLDEILRRALELQQKVHAIQEDVNRLEGGLRDELSKILRDNLDTYLKPITDDIVGFVNDHPIPTQTPTGNSPGPESALGQTGNPAFAPLGFPGCSSLEAEQFKAFVRRRMIERLAASPISTGFQVAIKQRLQDLNAEIRSTLDTLFQQVNEAIRDLLSSQLTQLDNSIAGFLGPLNDVMGSGQIQGYASINDDSLRQLRLDGRFSMSVPDEMQFRAYLEILQLNSEGSPGCKYSGGPSVTEVKIGALDVPLDWISKGTRMDLHTKFTTGPSGPLGFAGSIGLRGKMTFEVVEVNELVATIAFGEQENYFGARARARLNSFEVAGGLWFGRACDILPIQLIDKSVSEIVPLPPPIIGGYAYAEGWVPVNEWIGIPSTCLLNIRAGVGAGVFFFESGHPPVRTFGGKILLGADAEILCIAHAQLIVRLIGAKSGNDFKLRGQGEASLEIGACPFCIELSKSVELRYENGDWDVDF